jgi:hypothetical protein
MMTLPGRIYSYQAGGWLFGATPSVIALILKTGLSFLLDGSYLCLLLCGEEIENLVDYLAVFVDTCTLVGHVVSVETAVAQQTLLSRLATGSKVVLTGSGQAIVLASVGAFPYFFDLVKCLLDEGYALA